MSAKTVCDLGPSTLTTLQWLILESFFVDEHLNRTSSNRTQRKLLQLPHEDHFPDPGKELEAGSFPITPSGGVIRRMRHWRMSVGTFCWPGPAGPHECAGQSPVWPLYCGGPGSAGQITRHDRQSRQRMRSTHLLHYRRRHHRLPGFIAAVTWTAGPRSFGGAGL
jgi:hypothetical protein